MDKIKTTAAGLAALLAFSLAPPALAQNNAAPAARAMRTPPETFIAQNITQSLAILNDTTLSPAQRSQQFEALLLSLTDTRRIALFALGRHVQTAPETDREAFVAAFQDYSVAVYRSYLGKFSGQTLTVTGSTERAPGDFIVSSTMTGGQNSAPLVVQFRVRTDAGKPVVTDLGIMGIWLAITQRDDFAAYLGAHNGSVPALTAYIRDVTARYR